MNNLVPMVVCGIFAFAVYRILELYARKKERMAIIEKLQYTDVDPKVLRDRLNLPLLGNVKLPSSWPLRASLLLIGVGIGLIIGFILESTVFYKAMLPEFSSYNWDVKNSINNTVGIIYFACVSVFGGLGLLIAYFVEQKKEK